MKKHLLIFIVMFVSSLCHAQKGEILHVVFEPDTITFSTSDQLHPWVYIDLDKDGFAEWLFRDWCYSHVDTELRIVPNAHLLNDTLGLYQKLRLHLSQFGDTLSDSHWGTNPEYEYTATNTFPYHDLFFSHEMMGVRYQVEDGYCYGWMEYSVRLYDKAPDIGALFVDLILHQMAYCTIPNYPLIAGQTDFNWNGTEPQELAFATIHPNPTNSTFTINGRNLNQIEIYNNLGQVIISTKVDGETVILDLSSQPAGVYLVNVTDIDGKRCMKKVIKQTN